MNGHKIVVWNVIYIILILEGNHAKTVKKRGVMDNFNGGIKMAGQMFGINTAADVANLVAKAFSSNRSRPDLVSLIQNGLKLLPSPTDSSEDGKHFGTQHNDESGQTQRQSEETGQKESQSKDSTATPFKDTLGVNFGTSNLITSMLRLVGFDASKLGALAINALIMLASAIGNTIMGTMNMKSQPKLNPINSDKLTDKNSSLPKTKTKENDDHENAENGPEEIYAPNDHQPRAANDATTIEWFLQNAPHKIKTVLKDATHTGLSDKLIDMIANYESSQDQAPCLKLLVCKSSPFIWGMQQSLRKHIEPPQKNNENINLNDEDENKSLLNVNSFFTHLPNIDEYQENGEKCEKLYAIHCDITDLYDKKY